MCSHLREYLDELNNASSDGDLSKVKKVVKRIGKQTIGYYYLDDTLTSKGAGTVLGLVVKACGGNHEVVETALSAMEPETRKDPSNGGLISYAVEQGWLDVMKVLWQYRVPVYVLELPPPLYVAAKHLRVRCIETMLKEFHQDPTVEYLYDPLKVVCEIPCKEMPDSKSKRLAILDLLIEAGAEVQQEFSGGDTPLGLATDGGCQETISRLKDAADRQLC
jgi:hypothetical protein